MTAEHRLIYRVEQVADRLQRRQRLTLQSRAWLLLSLVGLALLAANWLQATPLLSPVMTGLAGVLVLVGGALYSFTRKADAADAARMVEQRYPDLDARLVTAIVQKPNREEGGYGFLQHEVISEALLHAQRHDWREAVSTQSILGAKARQLASLATLVAVFVAATFASFRSYSGSNAASMADESGGESLDGYGLIVEPGDTMLERGTSLLVLARFTDGLPSDVTLVTNDADGNRTEIPLEKSLEDPLFGGRVGQVEQDLTYHVRFDDRQSDEYRVTVFDYPRLLQADATIVYPTYTGLDNKRIEDVRRVSVVEGSTLKLTCTLNKEVASATLVSDGGDDQPLAPDPQTPNVVSATWQPQQKQTFTLMLADEADRKNKQPPKFVIDVIPNQTPDLKVAFPSRDIRVSPIQELALEAVAWDDFGLKEFGLVYQLPDGQEESVKLGGEAAPESKVDLSHELSFETMQAQPNELVVYYFYADDVGPDGNQRRSMGNMYFAEVRHFEEIYRQSQQSAQGQGQQQGQQGGPAQQLLKLQREIVIANWNLLRRETGKPSARFSEDAGVIADSQQEALALANQAQGAVEDLLSQQYLSAAIEHMQASEEHLRNAAETPAVEPLSDAGVSAQGAYRALLKLQARENLVQQSQNSQSSSQGGGRQQQLNDQLQQLELKNNRNRYESEQQDSAPADREALQALNRLRELARRQGDLNEKIQELENELRTAETEEEREEIQRQLKRLQEEQQQLLRDLDELNERMERPENRAEMAEARQQLQQTRDRLRETKEQLQSGQVSQALASGTRAERELDKLRDDFRDQTASQFADTMRQLREEVRDLSDREQEIGDRLAGNEPEAPEGERRRPRLRDDAPAGDDENLQEAFEEQRKKLSEVMQEAEEIVRESEVSEPLLSKKLYDTIRDSRVDQPEESLSMTSQFLRLGLDREAQAAEQQARRGIDKLREGAEQAAESVLGNEVESLERAQQEIDDLARAIGAELAQADPESAEQRQRAAGNQQSDQSDRSQQRPSSESQQSADGQPSEQQEQENSTRQGQRDGEQEPQQSNRQSSEQQSEQPGQPSESESQQSGQDGQGQPGQRPQNSEQQQQGQRPGQQPSSSEQQAGSGQQQQAGRSSSPSEGGESQSGRDNPLDSLLNLGRQDGRGAAGPHLGPRRPLTSSEFTEWSDRMRDVEEMLDDPRLRADVARIRDEAREMRIDVKTHAREPNWELVRLKVYGPMLELQDRIAEELARLRPNDDKIVPLDRDPVPDRYAELVQKYYQQLGASGRE